MRFTSSAYGAAAATIRNKTTMFKPNGKQEVARRLRQVAAGQLTIHNGLKEHGNE